MADATADARRTRLIPRPDPEPYLLVTGMRYFDLRLPLGWLFVVLGLLLAIAGLATPPPADTRSLAININLCWGGVMVAFGLLCLWLARREARRRKN